MDGEQEIEMARKNEKEGKKECKKQSWWELKYILEVDAIADSICSFVACW